VCGGYVRVRLAGGAAVPSKVCHVGPLSAVVSSTRVERCIARVARRGEAALVEVGRGVGAGGALGIHGGQQVRGRGGGLRGHLCHEVVGVDRQLLLLLLLLLLVV
jgi:hypothetical protein